MRAARKGNACKRPIPGHAQPHWLEHGAEYLEPSSDAARRAKRAPRQHPCRRWGLGLNSGSIRIVLLDAIPIRQFNAVFGTGFGSVFPSLKC